MNDKLLLDPHKDELRKKVEHMEKGMIQLGAAILKLSEKADLNAKNVANLLKLVTIQDRQIDQISKYLCKECGFAYDTPNHELGCENDNEDNNRVDRAD